jgi:hypothetical protein
MDPDKQKATGGGISCISFIIICVLSYTLLTMDDKCDQGAVRILKIWLFKSLFLIPYMMCRNTVVGVLDMVLVIAHIVLSIYAMISWHGLDPLCSESGYAWTWTSMLFIYIETWIYITACLCCTMIVTWLVCVFFQSPIGRYIMAAEITATAKPVFPEREVEKKNKKSVIANWGLMKNVIMTSIQKVANFDIKKINPANCDICLDNL